MMAHGNSRTNWHFAHDGRSGGLPITPCDHKHKTLAEACGCAARKQLNYVCEVINGKAHGDTQIEDYLGGCDGFGMATGCAELDDCYEDEPGEENDGNTEND